MATQIYVNLHPPLLQRLPADQQRQREAFSDPCFGSRPTGLRTGCRHARCRVTSTVE